ncbi:MAG: DUF2333 family protein, partial [Pseudomonadota bacterium]
MVKYIGIGLALYLVVCAFLGLFWWNSEPDPFDVVARAEARAAETGEDIVVGYVTTNTVMELATTLLEKRGGYLSNDIFPPSVLMDNIPEWEFGVLTQIRDAARVFRSEFSRSQSQSTEDVDLSEAEGKFFFDNSSWAFPQTEDEYRDGIRRFRAYLKRLSDPKRPEAQFYARSDNLRQYLQAVETRLGSLAQRLASSVGERQVNIDLAGDPTARQSTRAPDTQFQRTPWLEIDNVFYEARGQAWALLHILRALEVDFAEVLEGKNAKVSLERIIQKLEPTQDFVWSPMILNGEGLGFVANHSLVMASYISRVNAATIDLR